MRRGKRVVILGGGIAGMSAAHELIERGFAVEVFERKRIPGGKARSIAVAREAAQPSRFRPRPGAREAWGRPLPGEHGFRFFPGFYRHVVDTMRRIPYRGGSVAENLVDTTDLKIASFNRSSFLVPAQFPRALQDLKTDIVSIVGLLSGQVGVASDDVTFFGAKLWQFLTSCEERRMAEYERTNWWDFVEADTRSSTYQSYFGNGITRSLVAAKAGRASTRTIGSIFLQIAFDILLPNVAADRLLNGPTNDVWIDPWLVYLRQRGVVYHFESDVRAIHYRGGVVSSATVAVGGSVREVTADYFIGALPVERMAELVSPELLGGDPTLVNLNELTEYVEWMNGVQFYLTEDLPINHGHTIYIDSPWALTSVSQAQFWNDVDLSQCGDGKVKGILSVDISDWDVEGLNGKQAQHCTREEIAYETWEQLKRGLNIDGEVLRDRHLHSWFLDPGIDDTDADADPSTSRLDVNAEPLLVNYVDTWRLRPEAVTRIGNFFLAADYVRTFTDLATMEAANEAARRAVNGVLRAAGADGDLCGVWKLEEPEVFAPFRALDRGRFRQGLPWDSQPVDAARSPGTASAPASTPSRPAGPSRAGTRDLEVAAAEARASSDQGLRRLRIVRTP